MGTPQQKFITKLNFDDYGISILNKGCENSTYFSNDNNNINPLLTLQNSSSTFNMTYDILFGKGSFYYKVTYDAFYATDNFYLLTQGNKEEIITDTKFIYSPGDNKKNISCVNIGFKSYSQNLREVSLNIIKQLKKKNIINNYDWNIIFDNGDKNADPKKGIFVLGVKPHEYDPGAYSENFLFASGSKFNDIVP